VHPDNRSEEPRDSVFGGDGFQGIGDGLIESLIGARPGGCRFSLISSIGVFLQFNGLRHNIDGLGRSASDNNTFWVSVNFAF